MTMPSYIETGKYIKYRDGTRGRVLCTDRPVNGAKIVTMTDGGGIVFHGTDGTFYGASVPDADIIGPWGDLPPWPEWAPPFIVAIARDENGVVYMYSSEPRILANSSAWWSTYSHMPIPPGYAPDFGDLPWDRCIIYRPGYEGAK